MNLSLPCQPNFQMPTMWACMFRVGWSAEVQTILVYLYIPIWMAVSFSLGYMPCNELLGRFKGPICRELRPSQSERKHFRSARSIIQAYMKHSAPEARHVVVLLKALIWLERFLPSWHVTKFRLFFIADHVIAFFTSRRAR